MSQHARTPLTPEQIQQLLNEKQLLLIDKPLGKTSHDVVNMVRRQTGIKRVGHAGTLDPLATGLLLVLVGREATRYQDQFMGMDKVYEFTAELGHETDTYDAEGVTTATWPWELVSHITEAQLREVLSTFVGEYDQEVPAYSAVKVHGKKLYEQARAGKEVVRPIRRVKILDLQLLNFQKEDRSQKLSFSCQVHCGSGTYIRSLAVDIGKALGVGATVTALRRLQIGLFTLPNELGQ